MKKVLGVVIAITVANLLFTYTFLHLSGSNVTWSSFTDRAGASVATYLRGAGCDPQMLGDLTDKENPYNVISPELRNTTSLKAQLTTTNATDRSFVRAVLLFVPSDHTDGGEFAKELRWLHRSWQEMLKTQPEGWRTDIVAATNRMIPVFNELKCEERQRESREEPNRCVVIPGYLNDQLPEFRDYRNVYSIHAVLWSKLDLHAYDWVLRSDIDAFLTPAFSKWRPDNMVTGGGGYVQGADLITSSRLRRIADNLRLQYKGLNNVGSSWFGPVPLIRRAAVLSLACMGYLKTHEFTKLERSPAFGVQGWPEWHYGVLSLYGGDLAINHLATEFKIEIHADLLDFYSTSSEPVDKHPHIHTWHTDEKFSKFRFFAGAYNSIDIATLDVKICKDYCMYMAVDSIPKR